MILLEDSQSHAATPLGYLYEAPEFIIECSDPAGLNSALQSLDEASARGYHLAGWMAYECAYGLEPRLHHLMPENRPGPLLWFGAFTGRKSMNAQELALFWQAKARGLPASHAITNQRLSQSKRDYLAAIAKIHAYLQAGDVYQINYTVKNCFDFEGDAISLYRHLRQSQPVEFSAFMEMPEATILSFSPELFLRRTGTRLKTRPMKGTAKRGMLLADDMAARAALQGDEKSRAENLMILDLLRNDLSRIALAGSVKTTDKFKIEVFRSLLQMTSSVEAEIAPETRFSEIIRALFPCGSITGAPKIRAIEIIRELECEPRGIYTGAIGYITPEQDFCFSVPIRTISLAADADRQDKAQVSSKRSGKMGIGGGIVADSVATDEFNEALLKGRFATHPLPAFDLIETLKWQAGTGFLYLSDHLQRLENSARYFAFAAPARDIRAALKEQAGHLNPKAAWRVRLLLSARGEISLTASPLAQGLAESEPQYITVSPSRVNSQDPLLYHKTTRRALFESEFARACGPNALGPGAFTEVIFLNEKNEICEGSRSTLLIEKDGRLLTPALTCGLLPGIMRRQLLKAPQKPATEAILTLKDLGEADKIFIASALRGLREVKLHAAL